MLTRPDRPRPNHLRLVEPPSDLDPSVEAHPATVTPPHVVVARSPGFNRLDELLAILQDLQPSDLREAGAIDHEDEFDRYAIDPIRWFLDGDTRRATAFWLLVESRRSGLTRAERKAVEAEVAEVARG